MSAPNGNAWHRLNRLDARLSAADECLQCGHRSGGRGCATPEEVVELDQEMSKLLTEFEDVKRKLNQ